MVEFDYRAVGLVAEVVAYFIQLFDGGENLIGSVAEFLETWDGKTELLEPCEQGRLSRRQIAGAFAGTVEHDGERARGDDGGIELLQ